jgi:hypothetical protein
MEWKSDYTKVTKSGLMHNEMMIIVVKYFSVIPLMHFSPPLVTACLSVLTLYEYDFGHYRLSDLGISWTHTAFQT